MKSLGLPKSISETSVVIMTQQLCSYLLLLFSANLQPSSLCWKPSLTSSTVLLLFLDAVFDAVVLLVDVLVSSDLAEHAAGLLGQPTLDQPARALWQEEESQELKHSGNHRQAQHVPGGGGREHMERNRSCQLKRLPCSHVGFVRPRGLWQLQFECLMYSSGIRKPS